MLIQDRCFMLFVTSPPHSVVVSSPAICLPPLPRDYSCLDLPLSLVRHWHRRSWMPSSNPLDIISSGSFVMSIRCNVKYKE